MEKISEETAQKMIKQFRAGAKATAELHDTFIESMDNLNTSVFNSTKASLMCAVVLWKVKVSTSYFFTRWYYKRKLNKAEQKLKSLIKYYEQIEK